jgi:hypothetical protein
MSDDRAHARPGRRSDAPVGRALRRPSYATIASVLAIAIALAGGSAYAASHYLITRTAQFSPKVLTALKGATGPAGSPGAPGATGPTGPAVASATTVDGQTMTKIFYEVPDSTPSAEVYSGDGLSLQASCSAAGEPGLTATSTDPDAELNGSGDNDSSFTHFWASGIGGTFTILSTSSTNRGSMSFAYANTSNQVVTATFGFDDTPSFGGTNAGCGLWATVVATS